MEGPNCYRLKQSIIACILFVVIIFIYQFFCETIVHTATSVLRNTDSYGNAKPMDISPNIEYTRDNQQVCGNIKILKDFYLFFLSIIF